MATSTPDPSVVQLGHSPDPDDAFMFHALVNGKVDCGALRFRQIHEDIETLNRRALEGQLEVTAVSIHAYAHLFQRYRLMRCGASMGDGYGPRLVARRPMEMDELRRVRIAVPGRLTSAFLALGLYIGGPFPHQVVPFDRILEAVLANEADAGLLIHEGQLTYADHGLTLVADLGEWWGRETGGLPLPLGANAIRKDLSDETQEELDRLLLRSIDYALEHRQEALEYASTFGRGLDPERTDEFVGMYVNDWTRDLGDRGRKSIQMFLDRGFEAGFLPARVTAEFVGS